MSLPQQLFDLVVIGGGFSGLGVARDAAHWGFQVLLLDRDACMGATSANSLRIVHGGFRYLQTANLPRILRSIREQRDLLNRYPGFISPLPCLMPLARRGLKSGAPARIAAMTFSAIARSAGAVPRETRVLSPDETARRSSVLQSAAPYGSLLWHDAVVSDLAGFGKTLRVEAEEKGVVVKEGAEVSAVEWEKGRLAVRASYEGTEDMVHARAVVNAAGPWISSMRLSPPFRLIRPPLRWVKGFNLRISRQLEPSHGIGVESREGRLFFFVPRGAETVVGTWYRDLESLPSSGPEPGAATVSDSEIHSAILEFNEALPAAALERGDVTGVEAGFLPARPGPAPDRALYGEEILLSGDGYVEIISTKFTTFTSQARKVLSLAAPFLKARGA